MQIQERFIVPALGAIILLAVFGFATRGASPIYPVLLGLLGLAAAGTYFFRAPAVQVEVRIAIAALGLIILIFYFSSVSFWLALLAFGAIGASQIRHGSVLTMPPHTVAYVKALLEKQGASGAAGVASEGGATPQTGDVSDATAATAPGSALQGLGVLQRMLRVNVGGIGGSVLGAFILLSIFTMPYVALVVGDGWSESETLSVTFREVSEEFDREVGDGVPGMLFIVLAVVAAVSTASVVLPRWAVIIAGIAGMAVTLLSYVYIFAEFSEAAEGANVSIITVPHIGWFLAGGCFLAMTVLGLIPRLNRSNG